MDDLLSRLDAAIDGLCPCGADPRPDSAYCSYDCEPNHVATHTDRRESGNFATPMRWRPDLVTAADDSDLTPVDASRPGYNGLYNPSVYRRTDGRLHLRLDDGHRFVGCDVDAPAPNGVFTPTAQLAITKAWRRLDQELGNGRHLEADPWAEARSAYSRMAERTSAAIDAVVLGRVAPLATDRIYGLPEGAPLLDAITVAQSEAALRESARLLGERARLGHYAFTADSALYQRYWASMPVETDPRRLLGLGVSST